MTTARVPCPAQCGGVATIVADDRGTTTTCDTCAFQMVRSNRGQLDIGIIRPEPTLLDARNDYAVFFENFSLAARDAMRRAAILQEITTLQNWATTDDVGVQAIHVVATHIDNGYGLASSTRREQPGG